MNKFNNIWFLKRIKIPIIYWLQVCIYEWKTELINIQNWKVIFCFSSGNVNNKLVLFTMITKKIRSNLASLNSFALYR